MSGFVSTPASMLTQFIEVLCATLEHALQALVKGLVLQLGVLQGDKP
jgi:hypothetical protein